MRRLLSSFICILAAMPVLAATSPVSKTVTDGVGRKVTIPTVPKRIVVLHEPALGVPLADLGVYAIGSYGRKDDGSTALSADFYRLILGHKAPKPLPRGVGPVGNLSLEKIRALKPDLIIGTEHDQKKADQLAKIAPVYLQHIGARSMKGIQTTEQLAELLELQPAFKRRHTAYRAQVAKVKASLAKGKNPKTYLAVFLTDQINAVSQMSGGIQALEDIGLSRYKVAKQGAISGYGSTLFVPISSETFSKLNPDILVVMNSFAKKDRSPAATRASLDRIAPGWTKFLKPAREGRMVFADSAKVTTPSIASGEHMLKAISRWAHPAVR